MNLQFKTIVKANLEVEKWAQAACMPSFEDYMEVAGVGVASIATLAGSLMCMGKIVTKEAYQWLKSRPKLIQVLCMKGRLVNDMNGFEVQSTQKSFSHIRILYSLYYVFVLPYHLTHIFVRKI